MPHDLAIPLLPTPQTLRLTGGAVPQAPIASTHRLLATIQFQPDAFERSGAFHGGRVSPRTSGAIIVEAADLKPEAYRLSIRAHERGHGDSVLRIESNGPAGMRFAIATLGQILEAYRGQPELPCLQVEDSPSNGFATRGVMLDVSRDKVPTMGHLRSTIDLLTSLKFNHLQLYTEHTFAYPGHDEVWKDWSPITPAEARELAAYAAARGIDLAANQNCFGHLASWLKKPRYQPLAEIEGDNPWYFHHWERRGPFSLCPIEPKAEQFVNELLGELLPCFTSTLVNIGCDETFDVGWGRSKAEVDRRARSASEGDRSRARAQLYFEFVARIAKACAKHSKRPMMWADIALTHPELLNLMPREMIGLAWWYEPTDKFTNWIEAIRGAGHEAWVCPGTSSWRTFTGRTTERRANISDAAEQGAKAGATGFLVCDWGDMGHRQQWPITSQASRKPPKPRGIRRRRAASTREPQHSTSCTKPPKSAPGSTNWATATTPSARVRRCSTAARSSTTCTRPSPRSSRPATTRSARPSTNGKPPATASPRSAPPAPIANDLTRAELDHALDCAEFAADHAIAMRDSGVLESNRSDLIARAEAIRAEHERLWLCRNRPGGMAHASSFYTKVIHDLRSPSRATS